MGSASDPVLGIRSPRKSVAGPQAMAVPIAARWRRQANGGFARFIKCLWRTAKGLFEAPQPDNRRGNWQEWQDSNLQPPVLETGALPIELHSCGSGGGP